MERKRSNTKKRKAKNSIVKQEGNVKHMNAGETITVFKEKMQDVFYNILIKVGFTKEKANKCAEIFTVNTVDGVYTHGVNRFRKFVEYVKEGYVKADAEPALINRCGGMEQWNGNLGPGILNAVTATRRAMELAKQNTIGCVALANTNHWMRGGYYGWQAAKEGFVFIGFTNTIANMPAWNAVDSRLGNNPLVVALPFNDEAIVLDMAMSQFSFGAMEMARIKNEKLTVYGGYDKEGRLTDDPSAILQSQRPLPAGYWKGAGLSLLLDLLASILSGGLTTHEISKNKAEYAVSQVFIAIDLSKLHNHSVMATTINNIIADYHQSVAAGEGNQIIYPGKRVLQTRENNLKKGIPVLKEIWEQVLKL